MSLATPTSAAACLNAITRLRPTLAIVLGSGFHHVLTDLNVSGKIAYADIPGFASPTVNGHVGELYFGHLGGVSVLILSGRAHYYEGHPMEVVTFAARTLAAFGIRDLVLTNASGGINPRFRPGDFMLITDHINLMGVNPLRGSGTPGVDRFVDLTTAYDLELRARMLQSARTIKLTLRQGIYLAVSGPSYETPAEIQAFLRLGADAVGMSTVPETMAARQSGMRVVGVSCITNPAAGLGSSEVSHAEVLNTSERVKSVGARLLVQFASTYTCSPSPSRRP